MEDSDINIHCKIFISRYYYLRIILLIGVKCTLTNSQIYASLKLPIFTVNSEWPSLLIESAKSCARRACALCVFACLRACVLTCLACLRAGVFGVFAWLRVCVFVCLVCLHAYVLACLACLPLTYSRFCLIIYFLCINQGFAIKRKLLIHVHLS